jgi:hypothetical protein
VEDPHLSHKSSAPVTGRISDANWEIFNKGFSSLKAVVNELHHATGLPQSQIHNLWYQKELRRPGSANTWNIYGTYFKEYQEEEVKLTYGDVTGVPGNSLPLSQWQPLIYLE